ncbi:MAG TPA: transcription termination/antitermination protein NusG [Gemmataceae bacterium]|nr:transcription termination/antitermination protein NusG [Gemmataceae bacterium]
MTENVSSPDPTPAVTPPAPPEAVHEEHQPAPPSPPAEALPEAAAPAEPVSEAPAPEAEQPQASDAEAQAESSGEEQAAAEPETPPEAEAKPSNKHWYVVKVQSGREESIKDAIERRVKIEGLEEYYGQIVIPVERVTEMRNGKRVQKERKLYPGYLMVEVEYNDRILYLFRETSGVGDFVGGSVHRAPPPMSDREIERMLHGQQKGAEAKTEEGKVVYTKPRFGPGDRVKVTDGTFAGMEGDVKELHEAKGSVSVELTIFGRPVQVEFEYWQVEQA